MVINLVVPVTIRAASCWMFSNESFSATLQLSQTTEAYSRIGLRNEIQIWFSDSLPNSNCNDRIMPKTVDADLCNNCDLSFHLPCLFNVNPKCL